MAWFLLLIWTRLVTLIRWIPVLRQPDASQIKLRITEVVQHLENEKWSDLRSQFILPIRLVLPDSLLEKGWKIQCKTFGPFEHIGEPVTHNGWWLTSVNVPLRFCRAEFGMALRMTSSGCLVGLQFLPLHKLGLGNDWQMPLYADKNARESELTLGKGLLKVGGTLCLPGANGTGDQDATKARYPCVVLLAGSGPCDRDSTIEANRPFKDLALGLARHGIASVRFDKVTHTHAKAFRKRKNVTLTDEYVEHAMDAVMQAKSHPNIFPERVFILGHSLGAVVAPTIVAMDVSIAGCILMAGPAEPIYRCLARQLRYIMSLDGPESLYLRKQIDFIQKQAELADSESLTLSTPAKQLPFGIGPAYWLDYRRFQPIQTVGGLRKRVLILQGQRDYQVTVEDDYRQWQEALHGRPNVQMNLYENLNHLFISGSGLSTPLEYGIAGNVDEQVIDDLAEWTLDQ